MASISDIYKIFLDSTGICTDTRKLKHGQVFVALKGASFNGNKFAQQAIKDGAIAAIIDEEAFLGPQCYLVDNALSFLQSLALEHRKQYKIPVIGITGSNGKTTSKELIYQVLKTKYKVHCTQGNYNNHIGVPLTILDWPKELEIAIVEMGANHVGEIAQLCSISLPTLGVITNIGNAHLEGFGGLSGVIKAKTELYSSIEQQGQVAFLSVDDDHLSKEISKYPIKEVIPYALEEVSDTLDGIDGLSFKYENVAFKSNLMGSYNLANILLAIKIGLYFKLSLQDIANSIQSYLPGNNRSQLSEFGNNKVILDAYNANPSSMEMAIRSLHAKPHKNKVLILGDMLELGDYSPEEHQRIVDLLLELNFENVLLVGEEFSKVGAHKYSWVENYTAGKSWLMKEQFEHALILVKGSRGISLEKIFN